MYVTKSDSRECDDPVIDTGEKRPATDGSIKQTAGSNVADKQNQRRDSRQQLFTDLDL